MADLSDVEGALVALIAGALYPNGTDAAPLTGVLTRIYRGWPEAAALDADLAAGYVNVTIFPEAGGRNTTRHLNEWIPLASAGVTLTAGVLANTVTFGGSADPGQLAGVLADGSSYVYATGSNDSPDLVAANLATLMRADRIVLLRVFDHDPRGIDPQGPGGGSAARDNGDAPTGAALQDHLLVTASGSTRQDHSPHRFRLGRTDLHQACGRQRWTGPLPRQHRCRRGRKRCSVPSRPCLCGRVSDHIGGAVAHYAVCPTNSGSGRSACYEPHGVAEPGSPPPGALAAATSYLETKMRENLVIVRPFGSYSKGNIIADANEIARILASEAAANVVRVAVPDSAPANAAAVATLSGRTGKGS